MTQLPEPRRTNKHLDKLERLLHRQKVIFSCITPFMELLVANQADLDAELAKTKQAVVDDQTGDQSVVDGLDKIIADLKAGGDTSAAIAALQDIQAQIRPVTSTSTPPTP